MDLIRIRPVKTVQGEIQPPGSKSITNRALVCAALARGRSTLSGALDSDDTRVMVEALEQLGVAIQRETSRASLIIDGCRGEIPARSADLFVGNSGTTVRFLTAMLALGQGEYRLDGVKRMRQRPIGPLLAALRQLGGVTETESAADCPPVRVIGRGLSGGKASIDGSISSQFLSALLMAAPYAHGDVTIDIKGPLVSRPYVEMTCRVMRSFGVQVHSQETSFVVPGTQTYQGRDYSIEPDASAASYFWAAAAITGGSVNVTGLNRQALQGDVAFCDCLERMGCAVEFKPNSIRVTGGALQGIDVDMNAISDTVQTLAAVALFAKGPTRIRHVSHIRHKETDRIADLATELRKLGARVQEYDDGLTIVPGAVRGTEIETYDDHRMAMSLSLVGLRIPGVVILNPGCTAKTYPRFFQDLESVCTFTSDDSSHIKG